MTRIYAILTCIASIFLLTTGISLAQETDAEGSKDHPLFNRMPGFYIQRATEKSFETHTFRQSDGKEIQVEGAYTEILYALQPEGKEPSRTEILHNYENALVGIGGSLLFDDDEGNSYLKLEKDGKEIWVHVSAYITSQYQLYIIEKQAMAQNIVANARIFADEIRNSGHTAVYGIYFDSGKAVVKPESDAALAEIAKLLGESPDLKVHVVGHTDNVGEMGANMKLSQARAAAVVEALISRQAIDPARLNASAVGPLAPVSSNDTEDGRAKNRRVELVKQ